MAQNPAMVLLGLSRQASPDREIIPEKVAAAYSLADGRGDLAPVWMQGWNAAAIEGAESQSVFNPYSDSEEVAEYEAWQAGFGARP